jgi:cation/acetate symporter
MFWRNFTTRGAQASILFGTVSTLLLIWMSPTIQIDLLKHSAAYFPYRNPGLFTIPLSFAAGILVSLAAPERAAQDGFARLEHQIHVGEEEGV